MTFTLYAVRIFSIKWTETVAFYRDVVGLPVTFADEDMGWAQFSLGSADLGVERCDPADAESAALVGRFIGTSIAVDDIQSVYADLIEKGVEFVGPPEKQAWGGVLAHFKDPDGNVQTLLGQA